MTTLDLLTTFWKNWIMLPSFILGIIGFFFFVYSVSNENIKRKKSKITGISLLIIFAFNWFIGFSLAWSLETLAKNELMNFLNQPNIKIEINGEKLVPEYLTRVISELKKIENLTAHHSHPTDEIEIKISSEEDSMTLVVRQDSEKKYEFWVFSNRYNHTKENIIGKLNTLVFIKYFGG